MALMGRLRPLCSCMKLRGDFDDLAQQTIIPKAEKGEAGMGLN